MRTTSISRYWRKDNKPSRSDNTRTELVPSGRTSRHYAAAISAALAMALATTAFAAPPTPTPTPNTSPTAIATISPTSAYAGDTITLDGSDSHPNGSTPTTLDYLWQQVAPAAGISLSNNMAVSTTFAAPVPSPGTNMLVTFKLKVTDPTVSGGAKNTISAPVTTTIYALPAANAGPDETISIRETEQKNVTLSGSGTISRGAITYSWTQTDGPAVTWLTAQNIPNPQFRTTGVAAPGTTLTFNLVVGDGTRVSTADQVGIALNTVANNVPVANAGVLIDPNTVFYPSVETPVFEVDEKTPVTLYGAGTDADNDSLTYTWTLDSGTVDDLAGSNTVSPTFTAPDVTSGQQSIDLTFKLVLNDSFSNSVPSFITVRVLNTNDPPTAVAKAGKTLETLSTESVSVDEGNFVLLDGNSSTDQNVGDTLTYLWTQTGTPAVAITGPNTANASFTAPFVPKGGQTLLFKLTVTDQDGLFSESYVSVVVGDVNHTPLADAGADANAPARTEGVMLDGSNSADTDSDTLSYAWVQLSGTAVVLNNANTATPSFTAPTVGTAEEDLVFQLTVDDGTGYSNSSSTDTVTIHVTYVNRPPTANAGPNQAPDEHTVVTLDGSGSSDPDMNELTYSWSQLSGPSVTLSDASAQMPTFTAPFVDRFEADIVMQLLVDDGYPDGTSTSNVTVHIKNLNHVPTADAGLNASVQWGKLVNLSGFGSDLDEEEQALLKFEWTAPAGVTLSGSGANVSFTAPTIPSPMYTGEQQLMFTLKVSDPNGASSTDDMVVTVTNNGFNPIANPGGNKCVDENGSVTLNGSGMDPEGDPIHFTWTAVTPGAPSLEGANTATPSLQAPFVSAAGAQFTYQLLVWDDFGGWGIDNATVTVKNINDPPNIDNAVADVPILWAPDHRLVPIHISGVTDPNNNATIKITKVIQDELTNGLGDGDTPLDAIIKGDTVLLRAERSGKGDGRVYKVYFTASDFESEALDNSPTGYVKVVVPKSKKTEAVIDSMPNGGYDSTH